MAFLASIGAAVCVLISMGLGWLTVHIVGNLYGGFVGGLRFLRLVERKPRKHAKFLVRHTLRCWIGRRYNGQSGEFWTFGSMEVPLDGRDRVRRRRW